MANSEHNAYHDGISPDYSVAPRHGRTENYPYDFAIERPYPDHLVYHPSSIHSTSPTSTTSSSSTSHNFATSRQNTSEFDYNNYYHPLTPPITPFSSSSAVPHPGASYDSPPPPYASLHGWDPSEVDHSGRRYIPQGHHQTVPHQHVHSHIHLSYNQSMAQPRSAQPLSVYQQQYHPSSPYSQQSSPQSPIPPSHHQPKLEPGLDLLPSPPSTGNSSNNYGQRLRSLSSQPLELDTQRALSFQQNQFVDDSPHDFSRDDDGEPSSSASAVSRSRVEDECTSFISKLYHLLSRPEYENFLRWNEAGDSFILLNAPEFARQILPRFFRHSNVSSFVRSLNSYEFKRVSTIRILDVADSALYANPTQATQTSSSSQQAASIQASGFTHPYFQRGRKDLLALLRPRNTRKKKSADGLGANGGPTTSSSLSAGPQSQIGRKRSKSLIVGTFP